MLAGVGSRARVLAFKFHRSSFILSSIGECRVSSEKAGKETSNVERPTLNVDLSFVAHRAKKEVKGRNEPPRRQVRQVEELGFWIERIADVAEEEGALSLPGSLPQRGRRSRFGVRASIAAFGAGVPVCRLWSSRRMTPHLRRARADRSAFISGMVREDQSPQCGAEHPIKVKVDRPRT